MNDHILQPEQEAESYLELNSDALKQKLNQYFQQSYLEIDVSLATLEQDLESLERAAAAGKWSPRARHTVETGLQQAKARKEDVTAAEERYRKILPALLDREVDYALSLVDALGKQSDPLPQDILDLDRKMLDLFDQMTGDGMKIHAPLLRYREALGQVLHKFLVHAALNLRECMPDLSHDFPFRRLLEGLGYLEGAKELAEHVANKRQVSLQASMKQVMEIVDHLLTQLDTMSVPSIPNTAPTGRLSTDRQLYLINKAMEQQLTAKDVLLLYLEAGAVEKKSFLKT